MSRASRWRPGWPWVAAVGALVVVALGVAMVGTSLFKPRVADPTLAPVGELEPTSIPWYEAQRSFGNARPAPAYTLAAGLLGDDAPRVSKEVDLADVREELERSRAMPVAVLADGTMLYASDDGTMSTLHLGSVANDDEDVVGQVPGFVWAVALAQDASVAYVIQLDRVTQADAGVWAVALDGSGRVRRVMAAADAPVARRDFSLVARASYVAWLRFDATGHVLTRWSCGAAGECTVDILDLASGKATHLDDKLAQGFMGLEGGWVLTQPACFGPDPCSPIVVDLASGAQHELSTALDGAGIAFAGESAVVVMVTHDRPLLSGLSGIELSTGRKYRLVAEQISPLILWPSTAAVLPPGWIPVDVGDRAERFALRVSDGKRVELPPLPPTPGIGVPQSG